MRRWFVALALFVCLAASYDPTEHISTPTRVSDPLDDGVFDSGAKTVELATSSKVVDDLRPVAEHALSDPIMVDKPIVVTESSAPEDSEVVLPGMSAEAASPAVGAGDEEEEALQALVAKASPSSKGTAGTSGEALLATATTSDAANKAGDKVSDSAPAVVANEVDGEVEVDGGDDGDEEDGDAEEDEEEDTDGGAVAVASVEAAPRAGARANGTKKLTVEQRIAAAVKKILAARDRIAKAKAAKARQDGAHLRDKDHDRNCKSVACTTAFSTLVKEDRALRVASKAFAKLRERTAKQTAKCARAENKGNRKCRAKRGKLASKMHKARANMERARSGFQRAKDRYHKEMQREAQKNCTSDACQLAAARKRRELSIARRDSVVKQLAQVRKMELEAKEADRRRREKEIRLASQSKAQRKARLAAERKRKQAKRQARRRRQAKAAKARKAAALSKQNKEIAKIIKRILHIKGEVPTKGKDAELYDPKDVDRALKIFAKNSGWGRVIKGNKPGKLLSPLQMTRLQNYYKYYLSFASGVGPWW